MNKWHFKVGWNDFMNMNKNIFILLLLVNGFEKILWQKDLELPRQV